MGWRREMILASLAFAVVHARDYPASLKMSCSQLVLDRIDPLVEPGVMGSRHVHQIVGGNAFNATMDPADDPAGRAACTTCTFTDDFSNYWTAVMYFQARNGSYKRVQQLGALYHEEARGGGMTIYYVPQDDTPEIKIRAFMPGFRMRIGAPGRTAPTAFPHGTPETPVRLLDGITYTCLLRDDTRYTNLSYEFPQNPCPEGILTTLPFPPCWDGKNLDSPDHMSHVSYPETGSYHRGAPCPASHPVKIPHILLETRWDTRPFNDPELWPTDGRQPFVWSFGDRVGYGHHADYVFGWRADTLQQAFDRVNCSNQICGLPIQTIPKANECMLEQSVKEEVDGWLDKMPGGVVAQDWES